LRLHPLDAAGLRVGDRPVIGMSDITILLVDDHPVVREGYRRLLERTEGYRVVAEACDAASAYRSYRQATPDVVVIDLSLPGVGGLEAVRHIRQWDRHARILVFTMHSGAGFALKAFEAGASGYVTKSSDSAELVNALTVVAKGGRALSNDIAQEIAAERLAHPNSPLNELGPRETEILRLLASGWPAEEIATALHLSLKTVRNYHYQIKSKVGARNDAHLVWLAFGAGIIHVNDIG
jgi:DNA-binding NarL/FixJ family response regulator